MVLLALGAGCRCEEWLATRRQGPQPAEPVAARPVAETPPSPVPTAAPRPVVAPKPITPAVVAPVAATPVLPPPPPLPAPGSEAPADDEPVEPEPARPLQPMRSNLLQALPNLRAHPGALKHANVRFRGLRPAVAPGSGNSEN
jgi:hypothetical protein